MDHTFPLPLEDATDILEDSVHWNDECTSLQMVQNPSFFVINMDVQDSQKTWRDTSADIT